MNAAPNVGSLTEEHPAYPRTEDDLLSWIAEGIEESSSLDYKAAAALNPRDRAEIAKDVSAMGNSAGGIIIYGVAEHPRDSPFAHRPSHIDPVDGAKITKEWLEHVTSNGIRPRLAGILIHPIRLKSSASAVVYVVVVPQGMTAHQAVAQKRYYRRYNFESVPMEDHEVRDVMHRVTHAQVRLEFEIHEAEERSLIPIDRPKARYFWLSVTLKNIGNHSVQHVLGGIYLPLDVTKTVQGEPVEMNGIYVSRISINMAWRPSNGFVTPENNTDPLLPGMTRRLSSIKLLPTTEALPSVSLRYVLYADDAPPYRMTVPLMDIKKVPFTGLPHIPKENDFEE